MLWRGTPSQWINFTSFLICVLLTLVLVAGAFLGQLPVLAAGALLPMCGALWQWLTVRCTKYEVTTERIKTMVGVFSRRRQEIELFRVKDTALEEPFILRILSLANLEVLSSDKSTPRLLIPAIPDAESVREHIRTSVERMRSRQKVREIDFE